MTSARAAADCAKLAASALPSAAYDQLVTSETGIIGSGGNASPAQVRKAKKAIAAEVRASCPQFSYLANG